MLSQLIGINSSLLSQFVKNSFPNLHHSIFFSLSSSLLIFSPHFPHSTLSFHLKATSVDTTDITVWSQLASLASSLGNLLLARKALECALCCQANHWPAIENLCTVLFALQDYTGQHNALEGGEKGEAPPTPLSCNNSHLTFPSPPSSSPHLTLRSLTSIPLPCVFSPPHLYADSAQPVFMSLAKAYSSILSSHVV